MNTITTTGQAVIDAAVAMVKAEDGCEAEQGLGKEWTNRFNVLTRATRVFRAAVRAHIAATEPAIEDGLDGTG